jgi:radical SAM protein with 4Fe4S-binding SPASM domain
MSFPCKSPWTFARIMPTGDVQLCYQFTIGNLHNDSFEDIWFGEKANAVRARVAEEIKLCQSCDYFRFCLRSRSIDCDDPATYFSSGLLAGLDTVDFQAGTMRSDQVPPPHLVESIGAFNVVRFRGNYLGVPRSLGPIDLSTANYDDLPGLNHLIQPS